MPSQDSLMWWQVKVFSGLDKQLWCYGAGNRIMPKGWRQPPSWPHFISLRSVRVGRAISRCRCPWPPMVPTFPCWLRWQSSSAGTLSPAVRDLDDLEGPVQGSPSGWEPHSNPSWVPCGPKGISWPSLPSNASDGHYQQLSSSWARQTSCRCLKTAFLLPMVSLLYAFLLCCHCSASWTWLHILNQWVFCKRTSEMVMK